MTILDAVAVVVVVAAWGGEARGTPVAWNKILPGVVAVVVVAVAWDNWHILREDRRAGEARPGKAAFHTAIVATDVVDAGGAATS